MTHRFAIVFAIVAVTMTVTGCNGDSPLTSADGQSSNLSGTYIFSSPSERGDFSGRFIIGGIKNGDSITLKQNGAGTLTLTHQRKGEQTHKIEIDTRSRDFRWDKGALVYWHKASPKDYLLPGYAKQTRAARVYKRMEGDLVIESSFTEQGLMLFVIPFKDHYEATVTLQHVQ